MKPRVKLHCYAGIHSNYCKHVLQVWRCSGDGMAGYGNSPAAAYTSWKAQNDAELLRKWKLAEKFSPAR